MYTIDSPRNSYNTSEIITSHVDVIESLFGLHWMQILSDDQTCLSEIQEYNICIPLWKEFDFQA